MKTVLTLSITLAPLVFGLAAWILALVASFGKKRAQPFLTVSWLCCACSLWFPLQAICRWAENGDIAAILDCVGAYFLCATVLLLGNLLFSLPALFSRKKR